MLILQILFILHFIKVRNCLNNIEDNILLKNSLDDDVFQITPGIIETKYLYNSNSQFTFFFSNETNYTYDLIINFYSINWEIDTMTISIYNVNNEKSYTVSSLKDHIHDSFSIRLNKSEIKDTFIFIKPLNTKNGYEDFDERTEKLIINSIIIKNDFKLNVNEKEPIFLCFNKSFRSLSLSYKLKTITKDSFVNLLFSPDEKEYFNIIVSDEKGNELKSLNTLNSNNIFLTKELQNISQLIIKITYDFSNQIDINHQTFLKLEIITNNSPPTLLEKNYINKGFITSNLEYKHFYFEVFSEEGGEIILHDKRQSGILIGSIVQKESIKDQVDNPDIYPKIDSLNETNYLFYDKHYLSLSFNSYETENCQKGCYLLISYYHEKFTTNKNLIIGFEFTLLLRTLDLELINIPFNEYVFGYIEEELVNHYYLVYIPDGIEEISLQIQGQNFLGYYKHDKRKIKEKSQNKVFDLNPSSSKDIISIKTNNSSKYISILITSNGQSFSFYYFRVLLKKNNKLMLPLDSNMGNNCLIEKDYCYFILKNDYNIFSLNFSIFATDQENYHLFYYDKVDDLNGYEYILDEKDYINDLKASEGNYVNFDNNNSIKNIVFIVLTSGMQNILSTFHDVKKEIIPNIYSSKIYMLDNNNVKYIDLFLGNNFKMEFGSFYGEGLVNLNNNFKNLIFDQNMLGIFYQIPIKEKRNMTFQDRGNFIVYIKLINLDIFERIILGKTLNDFIQNENFPLYYTIPIKEEDNTNIDINFKILNLNEARTDIKFEIEGKIIDRSEYQLIKAGKEMKNATKGMYDICTNIGFLNFPGLNVNNTNIKKYNSTTIILIKISAINDYSKIDAFVQIYAIKNIINLKPPINQNILRTYNQYGDVNYYSIYFTTRKNYTFIFHKNSKCTEIENMNGVPYKETDGITKYSIDGEKISLIFPFLNFTNFISNGIYMIKYNYEQEEIEEYEFNNKYQVKRTRTNNLIFEFEFKNIKILKRNINDNIIFNIYSYLYLDNQLNEDLFNSLNSLIPNSIQPLTESKIIVDSNEKNFKISFNDVLKDKDEHHFIIHIKVRVNKNNDYFNDKYLYYTFRETLDKETTININTNIVIFVIMFIIIIFVVVLIFVIYYKMKKKNLNLEEILKTSFQESEKEGEEEDTFSYV